MNTSSGMRWVRLIAGIIMLLFSGLIYAWSIFVAPFEREFGWDRAQTALTFTFCIVFFVFGMLAGGVLIKKISARLLCIISAIFILLGFIICSRVSSLIGLYLSYGVMVGFGTGMANTGIISTIIKWFPDKTGIASGFLMMGFGLGGLALGQMVVYFIQLLGWRNTFVLIGIVYAIVTIIGALFIVLPSAQFVAEKQKEKKETKNNYQVTESITTANMLRTSSFWLYLCWAILIFSGGLMIIGHAASFATDLGGTIAFAAIATGILSLSNGAGRVIFGFILDKFNLSISTILTSGLLIFSAVILYFALSLKSLPLMIIGFILVGLSYGSAPTTAATYAMRYYGPEHYATNYSLCATGMIPSSLMGPYLAGVIYTASGGYVGSIALMLAFGIAALVVSRITVKSIMKT